MNTEQAFIPKPLDLSEPSIRKGLIDSMVAGGLKTLTCVYDDPFFYAVGQDGHWYRLTEVGFAAELYYGLKDDVPAIEEPGILTELVDALKTAAAGYFEQKRCF